MTLNDSSARMRNRRFLKLSVVTLLLVPSLGRARGWPKAKKSEANLRRYAPPPSKGRREKRDE